MRVILSALSEATGSGHPGNGLATCCRVDIMQIRAATVEDLPEVAAIYDHYTTSTVSTFDVESPGPDYWLPKVAAERVNGEHLLVVVADDGEVRGYAESSVFRPRPAYDHTREVSVYLGLDARQQGYGRKLYDELLGLLRADGIHLAVAVIALPNPASEALHRTCGFTRIGVLEEVGWKFGAWVDTAWWQLRLGEETPEEA
jgi:phosphinothricin acetyltransferase